MPIETGALNPSESSNTSEGQGHKAPESMRVQGGQTAPDGSGTGGGNGSKNPSSMPVRGGDKK